MNTNSMNLKTDSRRFRDLLGIPQLQDDEYHFSVLDVDFRIVDQATKKKASSGLVHGTNSENFIQQTADDHDLRIDGVISALNEGRAVAGGYYIPTKENPSKRSAETCYEIQLLFWDLDEWSNELPAPKTVDEFYIRFPDVNKYITVLKESASSNNNGLRFRGVSVLETPLFRDPDNPSLLKQTISELGKYLQSQIPCLAGSQAQPNRIGFGLYNSNKYWNYNPHAFIPNGVISYCVEQARKLSPNGTVTNDGNVIVKSSSGPVVIPSKDIELPVYDMRLQALKCLIEQKKISKQLQFVTPLEQYQNDTNAVLQRLVKSGYVERYWKKDSNSLYWKVAKAQQPVSVIHFLDSNIVYSHSDTTKSDLNQRGIRCIKKQVDGRSFGFLNIATMILYGKHWSRVLLSKDEQKKFERKLQRDGFGKIKSASQVDKRNKVIDSYLSDPVWCAQNEIPFVLRRTTVKDAVDLARAAIETDTVQLFEATKLWSRPQKVGPAVFQEFEYGELNDVRYDLTQMMHLFKDDKQVGKTNLVSAETGLGKTYSKDIMIATSDFGVLQIALTKDLAQEYKNRSHADAYMWKARDYNYETTTGIGFDLTFRDLDLQEREDYYVGQNFSGPNHENDNRIMCIQAEKHQQLSEKGADTKVLVCDNCPVKDLCKQHGYLSQDDLAAEARNLIFCGHQAVCESTPAQFYYKTLMKYGEENRGMVILDDFKLDNYIEDVVIGIADLIEWRHNYPNSILERVTKGMYDVLVDDTITDEQVFSGLKAVINPLTKKDMSKINFYMSRVPIEGVLEQHDETELSQLRLVTETGVCLYVPINNEYKTVKELTENGYNVIEKSNNHSYKLGKTVLAITLNEAINANIYSIETDENIASLPQTYLEQWNPILKLKRFFDRVVEANAPYKVIKNGERLAFSFSVTNPLRNLSDQRLVISSGTANTEHIESVFDLTVQHEPLKKVEWRDGNKCYQHSCGKFPRRSLLNSEKNENGSYEYTDLTTNGRFIMDKIEQFMKTAPDKKFSIITVKALRTLEQDRLLREHGNLISVHNYGATEGLDDISENSDMIILLGLPERRPTDIERLSKIIYATDEEPLSFELLESDDMETQRYTDKRVQNVFESQTLSDLVQAAGRTRLNVKGNMTLIVFSAQYMPGYTERSKLFEKMDLECVDSFDEFERHLEFKSNVFEPWYKQETERRTQQVEALIELGKSDNQITNMLIYPKHAIESILVNLRR